MRGGFNEYNDGSNGQNRTKTLLVAVLFQSFCLGNSCFWLDREQGESKKAHATLVHWPIGSLVVCFTEFWKRLAVRLARAKYLVENYYMATPIDGFLPIRPSQIQKSRDTRVTRNNWRLFEPSTGSTQFLEEYHQRIQIRDLHWIVSRFGSFQLPGTVDKIGIPQWWS